MQLQFINNTPSRAKVSIQGAAGSGRTYSALLLAYALAGKYEKVALIETGLSSAEHYTCFGHFQTLALSAPFTPDKFMDAIALCENSEISVIIIDTLSAEWTGAGGMLEQIKGEGEEVIHLHESLMNAIQQCSCHVIATLQTIEAYHLATIGGERKLEKHGLKPLQRKDIHSHFHTSLYLDMHHRVTCLKDHSSFFEEHNGVVIDEEIASLFSERYRPQNNIVSLQNFNQHESSQTA